MTEEERGEERKEWWGREGASSLSTMTAVLLKLLKLEGELGV